MVRRGGGGRGEEWVGGRLLTSFLFFLFFGDFWAGGEGVRGEEKGERRGEGEPGGGKTARHSVRYWRVSRNSVFYFCFCFCFFGERRKK